MAKLRIFCRAASIVFLFWLAMAGVSPASVTFNSLASFNKTNGNEPNHTALIQATDGNLYGTTSYGGANGDGAVFRISPSGTLTAIYSFCSLAGCADGANPYTTLVQASNGDLYGATYAGGASNNGTLFKITTSGTLTTLYSFCSLASCADGSGPEGQLAQDSAGNFYGTATNGGASNLGTVFKFSTKGVLTTLHSFSGADGENPAGGVIAVGAFLYGTAEYGGANGDGTVFKVTTAGVETTLHSFKGSDGANPKGWLVDAAGTFYGTTSAGANGNGTVFKMTAAGVVTTLYSFCSLASCADGSLVTAGLMRATDGNLYGVTDIGGASNDGTVYELTVKGVLTTLHSFDGTDGFGPQGTVVQDTNGDFYGITEFGGSSNDGTVFSIATGLKAFVTLESTSGKVGTKVGILGDGFESSSVVEFNGVKATTVTLTEPGLLTATVPTGATDGYVTVTTGSTTLTSTAKYTVHNSWASGAVMPTGTVQSSAAVLGGEIYVIGGANASGTVLSDVQIYSPTTNKWSTGTALPTATQHSSAAVVSNILYVFGGDNGVNAPTNAVWAYSSKTKAWTSKAAMPTARNGTLAVVEKDIIYVMGGNLGNGANFVATVEAYDPATNTWTEEAAMDGAKDYPGGGLIGTTIVVTGGATASGQITGDTEGYDAATNAWSELTADPTARTGPCSGAIGATVYNASGYINNAGAATTVNESFSLTKNKWTTGLLPIPQGTMFPAAVVDDGQLYCFGGWAVVNSTAINNVQIYQP